MTGFPEIDIEQLRPQRSIYPRVSVDMSLFERLASFQNV